MTFLSFYARKGVKKMVFNNHRKIVDRMVLTN